MVIHHLGFSFIRHCFISVWVWIYILSGTLLSTGKSINLSLSIFKRFFGIEHKLFLSMGGASIVAIMAVYLIIVPVVWVFNGD